MKRAFVYIMANMNRTIYVGVTSNLERRVWEHRTHHRDGFTKRYDLTKLVYIAEFGRIDDAIAWEKALKGKTRTKKLAIIEERNPRWSDLAWNWYEEERSASHEIERASHETERASHETERASHETERASHEIECASHGDPSLRSG